MNFWNHIKNFLFDTHAHKKFDEDMDAISEQIDKRDSLIETCICENEEMKNKLAEYANDNLYLEPVFDFTTMNAFSVERTECSVNEGSGYKTVIGYVYDKKIREWHMYCSSDMHNKLVAEFKTYLEKKHDDLQS